MSSVEMGDLDQIRIPKAAELVAETLRRRIVTREYEPGDLLPPEGTLMKTFNVARTTIRDAFRVLESEGLLEVRRGAGGGGRVRAPHVALVSSYAGLLLQFSGTTLADVHEARVLIEAPAAGLLAQRRDDAQMIDALEAVLAEEAAALDDAVELSLAEGRFHRLIVDLTGNRTLMMLTAVANRIIAHQVARHMTGRQKDEDVLAHNFEAHRAHERLVRLITVGAAEEAESFWRKHLESGTTYLASDPRAATTVLDVMS
jgi:DNA-binding FadR family transcriptional regulator